MEPSDLLIVLLAVVSALVCVLCCAARFGVSNSAILAEHEMIDEAEADAEQAPEPGSDHLAA